ncbi:DsbA family protein [Qingshengfaniella alkalisoli]|uniref:DsbA family protein n=1 Tax=Qingshengfaniella alkalisoli TaxID=2599296 RepID=A0A5B8IRP1_9RHOB|nr:DsbA family protein [Qingshengfaniella alkalisoli]QDY68872.1 DsbA family protein [Qingshengfaniella alkalisoli]
MKPVMLAIGLALMTAATPALAFDPANMTDSERAAFRSEVRQYLIDNPEVIIEAVNALEQRQQDAQATTDQTLISENSDAIFDDGYSWVGGNPDGDITMVEFLDYRCGYCKRAFEDVEDLVSTDGNIRFIVKEFPILGPQSVLASQFAIAARNEIGMDAYKDLHDALFEFRGEISAEALETLATDLGLDAQTILAGMNDDSVMNEIQANHALGQALQINGTPSFVIEDQMLRGYMPLASMKDFVAELRAE